MRCATLALCAAAWAAAPAFAQDTRNTLDLGVLYNSNRDALVDGPTGTGVPARASMDVGNSTGVLLAYEFMATPNLGLQLSTGFGGSVTVDGAGSLGGAGRLFKADLFSATGFVNWHFFEPGNALRPFVGIGANFSAYSGIRSYTGQSVDLDDSWSIAAQAGARYAFDRNWSMMLSLGLNWSKSDVTFSGAGSTQKAQIEFRPVVVGLAVGYSF